MSTSSGSSSVSFGRPGRKNEMGFSRLFRPTTASASKQKKPVNATRRNSTVYSVPTTPSSTTTNLFTGLNNNTASLPSRSSFYSGYSGTPSYSSNSSRSSTRSRGSLSWSPEVQKLVTPNSYTYSINSRPEELRRPVALMPISGMKPISEAPRNERPSGLRLSTNTRKNANIASLYAKLSSQLPDNLNYNNSDAVQEAFFAIMQKSPKLNTNTKMSLISRIKKEYPTRKNRMQASNVGLNAEFNTIYNKLAKLAEKKGTYNVSYKNFANMVDKMTYNITKKRGLKKIFVNKYGNYY